MSCAEGGSGGRGGRRRTNRSLAALEQEREVRAAAGADALGPEPGRAPSPCSSRKASSRSRTRSGGRARRLGRTAYDVSHAAILPGLRNAAEATSRRGRCHAVPSRRVPAAATSCVTRRGRAIPSRDLRRLVCAPPGGALDRSGDGEEADCREEREPVTGEAKGTGERAVTRARGLSGWTPAGASRRRARPCGAGPSPASPRRTRRRG